MIIRIVLQASILALLIALIVSPYGVGPVVAGPRLVEAQAAATDQCHPDDRITFAPVAPTVDEEMLIAVSSATPHRGVYMTGTERVTAVRDSEGQLGFVYIWSLTPRQPGPHRFQFFVDFTVFCAEASVDVAPSLLGGTPNPISLTPGLLATSTPFPLVDNFNGNSDNVNDNSDNFNDNSDSNSNSSNVNGNTTTTTTKLKKPIVNSATCTKTSTHEFTINGQRFGDSQTAADGNVLFSNGTDTIQAVNVLAWKKNQIVVLVPPGVGAGRTVYVVTSGGFADGGTVGAACANPPTPTPTPTP